MAPLLTTKLYLPPLRPQLVARPRLMERLSAGVQHALTLISAPAGSGKTTLVSAWAAVWPQPVAWLALDAGDSAPPRFLSYVIAALQTLLPGFGATMLNLLQSPQPPPVETMLTLLLNELTTLPGPAVLVLDDYHALEAPAVDQALAFLVEHLPPQLRLIIATREDPPLPLARLRARDQLTELRAADLRFSMAEAADFLNHVMGLSLTDADIAALEARTEGWIAGLQLAALSMRGHADSANFIQSFTGSHRFVLDYLVQEVLQQQPVQVHTFLLHTSILDRLCGPLCAALLDMEAAAGQALLEQLERANMFIVPLDSERGWYRYHHLFGDLLRQRLEQSGATAADIAALHVRASVWYEQQGLELQAFEHAAAAQDIERAMRLLLGGGMPLQFRGAVAPVLRWLASLPPATLDAHPQLWVMYASALAMGGPLQQVEPVLQSAEAALVHVGDAALARNLRGHIAAIRGLLAAVNNQPEAAIALSQRALAELDPGNLWVRTSTIWKLGMAYHMQGDRAAARAAYREASALGEQTGNTVITVSALAGLGLIQAADAELRTAAATFQHVLELTATLAVPHTVCAVHLGLARICYAWNDLDAAAQHGQQGAQLAELLPMPDRQLTWLLLLVQIKLAQGDKAGAAETLAQAVQLEGKHDLKHLQPELRAMQVLLRLRHGDVAGAAALVEGQALPLSQARIYLAQGAADKALPLLDVALERFTAQGWHDERLRAMILQALALQAQRQIDQAVAVLRAALVLAAPGGYVRAFLDEGAALADLLRTAAARITLPEHGTALLAMLEPPAQTLSAHRPPPTAQPLIEQLNPRELEVLQLIAQGLSNRQIAERLYLALSTVKGHNRNIFGKLQVQRRTEAVARARALGLLES